MSEDKLRQDIHRIHEDVRGYPLPASSRRIGAIIERVRDEDTVKSTGVSLPRNAATAMYEEYSRVGSNLIDGFQAAYAKGYQAGRDDAEVQQESKEHLDMKPGVVSEAGPEVIGNVEASTIPWHVAISNTGNAVAGKKLKKQLHALVKTSSRYGHVYEKTGPLTYTCTGCGGRIYPFTDTVPGVRDHRTGMDGCIKSVGVAQAGTEDAGACSGDHMHCPAIGCVWPDCCRDDSDFVGVEAGESTADAHNAGGNGDDLLITDALAETLDSVLDRCFNKLTRDVQSTSERVLVKYRQWRQTYGLRESYAVERLLAEKGGGTDAVNGMEAPGESAGVNSTQDAGKDEAQAHYPLARPSSPPPSPAFPSFGVHETSSSCPCSLCQIAHRLGLVP